MVIRIGGADTLKVYHLTEATGKFSLVPPTTVVRVTDGRVGVTHPNG